MVVEQYEVEHNPLEQRNPKREVYGKSGRYLGRFEVYWDHPDPTDTTIDVIIGGKIYAAIPMGPNCRLIGEKDETEVLAFLSRRDRVANPIRKVLIDADKHTYARTPVVYQDGAPVANAWGQPVPLFCDRGLYALADPTHRQIVGALLKNPRNTHM